MPSPGEKLTPARLVELYLEEKSSSWARSTLEQERNHLNRFLDFRISQKLTERLVLDFASDIARRRTPKGNPWSSHMVVNVLSALKRWLRWLYLEGHVLSDLGALVSVPSVSHLPKSLSEGEIQKLLEKGPRPGMHRLRDRALLELLYGTGLRGSELSRLELGDVDFSEGLLWVRLGKGEKDRLIPLGEKARKALLDYLHHERPSAEGALFVTEKRTPLARKSLTQLVVEAGRRAGLQKRATPHRIRHSYATHLLRRGASVRAVQKLLGHASLLSTQVYLDVEVSDLASMLQKSHPRGSGAKMKDEGRHGEND
jgi:site-specific recombinase XerD